MTWSMATVTCTLECHANPELTEGVMWAVSSGHFFVIRHPHCTEAQEVTCVVTSRVLLTARVCSLLSHVRLSVTPLSITFQAPLSLEFSRQEYLNRLPFPTPGDLLDPGIELASPAWAGTFFTTVSPTVP